MENGPFIDDFPIETSIYKGFSMDMLNNQRVNGPCSYAFSIALQKSVPTTREIHRSPAVALSERVHLL